MREYRNTLERLKAENAEARRLLAEASEEARMHSHLKASNDALNFPPRRLLPVINRC